MTSDRHEQLKECYLYVFDVFATGVSEVSVHLQVSKESARKMLKTLRDEYGLLGDVDVNDEAQGQWRRGAYKEMCWQSIPSYDDISHEEAEALFLERVPTPEREVHAGLSSYAVAQKIAKEIRRVYGKDANVAALPVKDMQKFVHPHCTTPGVMWEEGPYEWAIDPTSFMRDLAAANGFYLEPWNSFTITIASL